MDGIKRYSSSKGSSGRHNKIDKSKEVSSKSMSHQKLYEAHLPEVDNTRIYLPVCKQIDILRILPRYSAVLSRTPEDGVGMEDLDQLQQDFEKLLSTSSVRHRILKNEVESIDRIEDRREWKGKSYEKIMPSVKRKRTEEKPKYKDARNGSRILKTKNYSLPAFVNDLPVRYEIPKVIIPKHDVSDRFWLSVDPFCSEVGRDNVCFLEDLIKECSLEIDVKLPEVGEHYALEWAENSIAQEQNNGLTRFGKRPHQNITFNHEIKKNGIVNNSMLDTFASPLTQRLLDTLIEEKVMKQIPTVFEKLKSSDYTIKSNNGARGGICLDRRLRKELVEQGILDMEDLPKTFPPEDEILLEIKKCQQELSIVNKHNLSELIKLKEVVTKDIQKQEVKSQLDIVDQQVMNMYNRILMAKQKHAAACVESVYEAHLLPKPDLTEFETESKKIIELQITLHKKLTALTDMSEFRLLD